MNIKGKKINGNGFDNKDNIISILKDNGTGKEFYYNGKTKFIGEYYNGKRWKGKMYDYEENEEFEIEYGKGKGKEYNYYGKLIYEGEYFNEEKNGKGKEYINILILKIKINMTKIMKY